MSNKVIEIKGSTGELMGIKTNITTSDLYSDDGKPLPIVTVTQNILKHDYLRIYNVPRLIFMYIPNQGCYYRMVYNEFRVLLAHYLMCYL